MKKKTGKIFILEGGEGTGKTTVARYLADNIPNSVYLREPGGNTLSEKIRDIIVYNDIPKYAEALLFMAARNILVDSTIKPLLAEGKNIILDRFHVSTIVYQGFVKGCDLGIINSIHDDILDGLPIEKIFILDVDTATAENRIFGGNHSNNKFEEYDADFHKKIRKGYVEYAEIHSDLCILLDTVKLGIDEIEATIKNNIMNILNGGRKK